MNNKIFENVRSVEYDEKHIFCVTDNNFSKIVVIDITPVLKYIKTTH